MEELKFIDKINYNMYIKLDSDGYIHIGDYSEGKFSTKHTNGVCGYINEYGYETFLFEYDMVSDFHNGRALVQNKNGFYGYIDKYYNEVIPCKYLYGSKYHYGYAIVKKNNKTIVIDVNGKTVKELDGNTNFSNSVSALYENNILPKEVCIKKNKDIKIKEYIIPDSGVKQYSYYSSNGDRIIELNSLENRNFSGNFVVIKVGNDDYKIFNKKGKILKLHSCIAYNIIKDKKVLNNLKYKISCIENDGYISTVSFKGQDYSIIAQNIEDLNRKKIELINFLKSCKNNVVLK